MPTFNVRRIPRSVIDRLEGQDREAQTALLASDANTLQRLVAADALIIGPKGFIINRDTWISVTRSRRTSNSSSSRPETECRDYDNAGIRFDLINSECRYQGETIRGRFRVAQAWVTDHGRWQLASVQYTSAPA